ncbi:MAG TPA: helicase-related protein, partial [Candidatus Nanoarchaeia archaeon]|nr:helicase-related protein [Candidatus Nanoarchaeia archaeon]
MIEIKFKPRLYQETILNSCTSKNTLIVLPTGLGKTKLAILVAVSRLNTLQGKILFLTPTKPLAGQIRNEFIKDTTLGEEEVVLFSGEVAPEKRGELIKGARVIVSTPQTISNDIISKRLNLEEISLLVLDEAHRNVKEYDYTWLCKQYNRIGKNVRIIGLTASPGDDLEKIQDVCKNAFIEEIEFRSEDDGDVKPYVQQMNIEWVKVSLPEEYLVVRRLIESCYNSKLDILKVSGFNGLNTKSDLLRLMRELQGRIVRGDKDFNLMKSVSSVAEVLKIQHGLELLETQGMKALVIYMNKLVKEGEKGKTKAVKNLVNDLNFRNALAKANHYLDLEHPKLVRLKEIILENKDKKIIVFNQYRDSIKVLEKELNQIEGIKSRVFVGQNNKDGRGMTQKKQLVLLDKFRGDEFNVLLSSSIGEEGLDIPKVDLVIFYEPVPSAIRTIQRRGRTARMDKGRVIVLMTKNTRDEAYHWVAFHKERRMKDLLKSIKNKLNLSQDIGLNKYIDKIKIIVDFREKGSSILKNLVDLGVDVSMEQLDVGDFVFG